MLWLGLILVFETFAHPFAFLERHFYGFYYQASVNVMNLFLIIFIINIHELDNTTFTFVDFSSTRVSIHLIQKNLTAIRVRKRC